MRSYIMELNGKISVTVRDGVPSNLQAGKTFLILTDNETGLPRPVYSNRREFEGHITAHYDDGGNFVGVSFGELVELR